MQPFLILLAAALLPAAAAGHKRRPPLPKRARDLDLDGVEIAAASQAGHRVLAKARRLDGGDETTWVADYSLKFQS